MRSIINHLIQLQELTLIRDEQRSIKGASADLSELNKNIEAMTQSLTPEVRVLYTRLYKKDHIILAPTNNGCCSMCGMKLAISQLQSVKQCNSLTPCPGCARVLYDPTGAKWVADTPKRSEGERKVGIARFSSPALMIPDLKGSTPEEVIAELTNCLQEAHFIDNADKLTEAAIARETVFGTGIGHGLAFPHVRGIEGGGLSLAFGVSKKGVPFGGAKEGLAHIIFFSTIPTAVSAFYLKLLAGLTDSFVKESNTKAAIEAKTQEELWKVLTKATRYSVKQFVL